MKKIENVIFGICLALIIFMIIIMSPLSNVEEVYNFNIATAISNGKILYKDVLVDGAPLFALISAIALKLVGQELFYTRILSAIMYIICFILMCKVMKNFGVKREISNVIMFATLFIIAPFLSINTSSLLILFILQITLLEIKQAKFVKWKKVVIDILIGIFAGLAIYTKLSIGIILSIIVILNPLLSIKRKDDIKKSIIKSVARLCGILIPVIAFFIYLITNNAVNDYFRCSFNGFFGAISYSSLVMCDNQIIKVSSIAIPVILAIAVVLNIILKCKKIVLADFYMLTIYNLVAFGMIFTISDVNNSVIAVIPSIMLIVYLLKNKLMLSFIFNSKNKKEHASINNVGENVIEPKKVGANLVKKSLKNLARGGYKYFLEFTNVLVTIAILSIALWMEFCNNEELGRISKYSYQNHFKYIYISEDLNDSINNVNSYILLREEPVYILDENAEMYMIPIERYNKDYDLVGSKKLLNSVEDKIIESIKNENALYMIRIDEGQNKCDDKVRLYVKQNMELVETVDKFEVYR